MNVDQELKGSGITEENSLTLCCDTQRPAPSYNVPSIGYHTAIIFNPSTLALKAYSSTLE